MVDGEVCGFLERRAAFDHGRAMPRVFSILTVGVPTGTKMVAGMSRPAA